MPEVIYKGLENAGVSLSSIDETRVGCFIGSYASGKEQKAVQYLHEDYHDMQSGDPLYRLLLIEVGISRAILSNRISHFLNIKGPR